MRCAEALLERLDRADGPDRSHASSDAGSIGAALMEKSTLHFDRPANRAEPAKFQMFYI